MTRPRRNGKSAEYALVMAGIKQFREHFEREPLKIGIADGIVWATMLAPTWGINGYALVPAEGHQWSTGWPVPQRISKDVDYFSEVLDELLSVHGGVTYRQHPWVGFDTAHSGDRWPAEFDPMGLSSYGGRGSWGIDWDVERAEIEAQSLARQVAAYSYTSTGMQDLPDRDSIKEWTRSVNVELSDDFKTMRRDAAGGWSTRATDAADAMKRLGEIAESMTEMFDKLTPPPTPSPPTGRFAHLDIPTVQELNTDPPPTP